MDVMKKRWIILIDGFLVLLFMGISNAWSIFVVPLETTFNWTRSETSLAYTICILFFSIGSILAGSLSKNLSFRTILQIGACLIGVGFFASSKVTAVWQIYITYSILVGTGIGMGYNVVLSVAPNWFMDRGGLATGVLMMGYALSTAIFGPTINSWIANIGISSTFVRLAVICAAGILITSILQVIPTYEQEVLLPKAVKKANKGRNLFTTEMLKQPSFYLYFIFVIVAGGSGLCMINHLSPMISEGLKQSSAFAATIISVCSICNGISRLVWGTLSDKISIDKILLTISCIFVGGFGLAFVAYSSGSVALFVVAACVIYVAFGGNAACCPVFTRTMYGNRTFSLNYSVISLNSLVSAFLPTIIGSLQASTGSYTMPIMVLLVATVVALVVCIVLGTFIRKEMKQA